MTAKENIIKTLKDFGRLSTTRIASLNAIDYNYCSTLLSELKKEKKVVEKKETIATYWELNVK